MAQRQILHIVRQNDPLALSVIRSEAATHSVKAILIHQAARDPLCDWPVPVCRLETPDAPPDAPPVPGPVIGYDEMLDEILAADQVVVW